MKKIVIGAIVCGGMFLAASRISQSPAKSLAQSTASAQPTPTMKTSRALSPTQTLLRKPIAQTAASQWVASPTPPAPSSTPHWIYHPPGEIQIPILLYHHVEEGGNSSKYTITPAKFEAQIQSLKAWGYAAIPVSLLVESIKEGAYLPLKPIAITFDDGYRDVFQNALPIMERYGYIGTVYVIVDQIGVSGYLETEHLSQLLAAGWEIGSHTKSHANLRKVNTNLTKEIQDSRLHLENLLNTPITSFAYPFGISSSVIRQWVRDTGYQAGMGLGTMNRHTEKSRYYLSRKEVHGDVDLIEFASLLQHSGVIGDPLSTPAIER